MTVAALSYSMVLCGGGPADPYAHRYRARPIEKVKFGVPVTDAFPHDIPATLLVLLLKVNKEGPYKKDVWRAPGQAHKVQKLTAQMQGGRLVNIANVAVSTAASVIKKFLSKIPGGIFGGAENEERIFGIAELDEPDKQRDAFCRIVTSLPAASQHLLVLVFGTFRCICDAAAVTRMGADALGVSVAPSLLHTCIFDGNRAKIEDVVRFRIASEVVACVIKNFGYSNLFPRENYEFYARITGRTLRLDDNWLFTFHCPAELAAGSSHVTHRQQQQTQRTSRRSSIDENAPHSHTAAAVLEQVGRRPQHATGRWSVDESRPSGVYERRVSQQQQLHAAGASSLSRAERASLARHQQHAQQHRRAHEAAAAALVRPGTPDSADQLLEGVLECTLNESTHSLSYLEWVHRRQQRRMLSRSEWFLSPERGNGCGGGTSDVGEACTSAAAADCSQSMYDVAGGGGAHSSAAAKAAKQAAHPTAVARKRSLRQRQSHVDAECARHADCDDSDAAAAGDVDPLVRKESVKSAKKCDAAAVSGRTRVSHYRF